MHGTPARFSRLTGVACLLMGCLLARSVPGAEPLTPATDYRHIHRPAAEALFTGQPQTTESWCRDFLGANPDDPEAWFLLAGAVAASGRDPEVQAALEGAFRTGLTPERFVAGPRQALAPLVNSEAFARITRDRPVTSLLHGPTLGDPSPTGIRVWVRGARAGTVTVYLSEATPATPRPSGTAEADKDTDFTAVVTLSGLRPATRYHYWVTLEDMPPAGTPHGTFRTPSTSPSQRFAFAFGGGAAYKPSREGIWNVMARRQPDFFIGMGDNVYIDAPRDGDYQRYLYYRRQSRPEWRALTAQVPVYAIYDDHDFGTDDCSGGPDIESPAWKRKSWEVFRQNWVNPAYGGGPDQPGCWFRFARGDTEFFMLDGRYYRTDPKETPEDQRSMLGPVQRSWLLQALADSKATFKFLVSPVPWARDTKPGSLDTWDGFDREREQIFTHIAHRRIEGVVLLSADRHRHDVWKTERPGAYPLYEFESSKITNEHTHPVMARAVFSWNGRGFGWVEVDTTQDDPRLTYRIIAEDGREIYAFELRRSELTF